MPSRTMRLGLLHAVLFVTWVMVGGYLPAVWNGLLIAAMTSAGIAVIVITRPPKKDVT